MTEFFNKYLLVNYAYSKGKLPQGNAKTRPGDAICANSFVQSFTPKTTRRKRTIKKSKKIISNFVKTLHFHHLSHSTLSYLGKIKFDNTLKFSFFLDGIAIVDV